MNAIELSTRLCEWREILGSDVESTRGERLFDRYIDAADPRAVHSHVSDQVPSVIGDGDIHGLANGRCLLLGSTNNFHCIIQCDHLEAPTRGTNISETKNPLHDDIGALPIEVLHVGWNSSSFKSMGWRSIAHAHVPTIVSIAAAQCSSASALSP